MQVFDFSVAPNATARIQSPGHYVYYYSGATTSGTDTTVRLRAGTAGDEILLKPGQSMRLPDDASAPDMWSVTNYANVGTISGKIMIGEGEFNDNVLQVQLDTASGPITTTISGTATVQENLVAITGSYASLSTPTANTAIQVVAPAANTNGITIHSAMIEDSSSSGQMQSFVAKASAPTGILDGAVLLLSKGYASSTTIKTLPAKLKIPAGMGLYYIADFSSAYARAIDYTVH